MSSWVAGLNTSQARISSKEQSNWSARYSLAGRTFSNPVLQANCCNPQGLHTNLQAPRTCQHQQESAELLLLLQTAAPVQQPVRNSSSTGAQLRVAGSPSVLSAPADGVARNAAGGSRSSWQPTQQSWSQTGRTSTGGSLGHHPSVQQLQQPLLPLVEDAGPQRVQNLQQQQQQQQTPSLWRQQPQAGHMQHQQRPGIGRPRLSDAQLLVQQLQACRSPNQLLGLLSAHAGDCDAVAVSAAILCYSKLVTPQGSGSIQQDAAAAGPAAWNHCIQPGHAAAATPWPANQPRTGSRVWAVDTPLVEISAASGRQQQWELRQQQQQGLPSASASTTTAGNSHLLPLLLRQLLLLHLHCYRARQYANTLYALARMHCRDKALVEALLQGLNPARMGQLEPQELANITWALGRLRLWPQQQWMDALFKTCNKQLRKQGQEQVSQLNPAQQALLQRQQLREKHHKQGQGFKPQELSNMVWGLGRLHVVPPRHVLQQLVMVVQQQLDLFTPQQLSNIVWGLAHMRGPRRATQQQLHTTASSSSSSELQESGLSEAAAAAAAGVAASPASASAMLCAGADAADGVGGGLTSAWISPAAAVVPLTFLQAVAAAALPRLADFGPQELSCLLWGINQLLLSQQQQQQQQHSRLSEQQRQQEPGAQECSQHARADTTSQHGAAAAGTVAAAGATGETTGEPDAASLAGGAGAAAGAGAGAAAAAAAARFADGDAAGVGRSAGGVLQQLGAAACWQLVGRLPSMAHRTNRHHQQHGPGLVAHNQHHRHSSDSSIGSSHSSSRSSSRGRSTVVRPTHIMRVLRAHQHLSTPTNSQGAQQRHQPQPSLQQQPLLNSAPGAAANSRLASDEHHADCSTVPAHLLQQQQQSQALGVRLRSRQPQLPQALLQQLAAALLTGGQQQSLAHHLHASNTASSSNSSSRSSSSSWSVGVHVRWGTKETPSICAALLMMMQSGLRPSRQYLTSVLEVVHENLHSMRPGDFGVVAAALQGLGYIPAKPWVASFVGAAQQRFSGMEPEAAASLLAWTVQADGYFGRAAAAAAAAAVANTEAGLSSNDSSGSACSSLLPEGWVQGLAAVLQSKVRARQQRADRFQQQHEPEQHLHRQPDQTQTHSGNGDGHVCTSPAMAVSGGGGGGSSSGGGSVEGISSSRSQGVLHDEVLLKCWLQQQLGCVVGDGA